MQKKENKRGMKDRSQTMLKRELTMQSRKKQRPSNSSKTWFRSEWYKYLAKRCHTKRSRDDCRRHNATPEDRREPERRSSRKERESQQMML
jgi:hypothetical protein